MLTQARRIELSELLRPASPPRELDNVYTADQHERLLDVVRTKGPWKLIVAQHFSSAEELIATTSATLPEGFTPTLDMFLAPAFRGYLANYSALMYPELHDCFYREEFLTMARQYWNAEYAKPQMMLFNISGPCANFDPGHLDSPSFRGVRFENAPTWLCGVMGKSGLFTDYLIKMAQVITWFSLDARSGFTYWPDGPLKAPKRVKPPVYNRGVLVQNEMLMHRGEANGPEELQHPEGLTFDTVFTGDASDRDQWLLKNGDDVIARHRTDELRFLVHWSAEVFEDYAELKKNMDGSADLTIARAIDMLVDDVKTKGIKLDIPSEPLHDRDFIRTLNAAYDLGGPVVYPEEAPVSPIRL